MDKNILMAYIQNKMVVVPLQCRRHWYCRQKMIPWMVMVAECYLKVDII